MALLLWWSSKSCAHALEEALAHLVSCSLASCAPAVGRPSYDTRVSYDPVSGRPSTASAYGTERGLPVQDPERASEVISRGTAPMEDVQAHPVAFSDAGSGEPQPPRLSVWLAVTSFA